MLELKTELNDIISKISIVTDLIYQQKEHEAFEKLNELLVSVSDALEDIYDWDSEKHILGDVQQEVLRILNEAMQAMEKKDSVLLADILQYDLKEQFEAILENVK